MPERMVALSIGVGDARPLPHLAAAVNGAQAFHKWSTALGYQSTLVTDEDGPVTVAGLKEALEAILDPKASPIYRMLLYFAGHGLIREAEEGLWLLSDWRTALRAVAVEVLKRRLRRYGVKQIAIFADACRLLPADVDAADLVADAVLGLGPSDQPTMPDVEKFIAAQDGTATYSVPGLNPEDDRCLFSGVLLEGLWGTRPSAFSAVRPKVVTGSSLSSYLKSAVPEVAERYNRKLNPTVSLSFPEGDDVYLDKGKHQLNPPAFPPWPDASTLLGLGAVLRGGVELERAVTDSNQRADGLLREVRSQPRPYHFETGSGFAVQGRPVAAVWTAEDVSPEPDQEPNWWRVRPHRTYELETPTPVLIEFHDGLFAAVTAMPRFIGSVLRDERGVSALIYREIYTVPNIAQFTEDAIAAMEGGTLRAGDKIDRAVKLRQGKHVDPVLGVISAYLYDSIGDIESIRSMAYFYVQENQPIPYDIALLAQLRGEFRNGLLWAKVPEVQQRRARTESEERFDWTWRATPAVEGWVGGLWPWMRQGWTYLDTPAADGSTLTLPGLIELTKHLTSGRFATLDAQGGRELARLFKLSPGPKL